jgi:hypothetical protein
MKILGIGLIPEGLLSFLIFCDRAGANRRSSETELLPAASPNRQPKELRKFTKWVVVC